MSKWYLPRMKRALILLAACAMVGAKGKSMAEVRGYQTVVMPHPGRATSGSPGSERCEHLWPMPQGSEGLFDCGNKGVFALLRGVMTPLPEARAADLRAQRQRLKAAQIEPPSVAAMRVVMLGLREYRMRSDAQPPSVEHYKQISSEKWEWQTERELPQPMREFAMWDRGGTQDYWFVASNGDVWAMLDGAAQPRLVLPLAKVKALHKVAHVDAVNAWPIAIARDTAIVVHTHQHTSYLTWIGPSGVKALVPPPEPPAPPPEEPFQGFIQGPPGGAPSGGPSFGATAPRFARVVRVGSHTFLVRDRDLLEIMRDGSFYPWTLPENAGFSINNTSAHAANDVIAFVGQVRGHSAVFVGQSYQCKRLALPKEPIAVHFEPHHGLIVFDADGVGYVDSLTIQRTLRALPSDAAQRLVGRWEAHGTVGQGIGWSKTYVFNADGTFHMSAYPELEEKGQWTVSDGELLINGNVTAAKFAPLGLDFDGTIFTAVK